MADFLHGVETIEVDSNGRTVTIVKSAVIALVGIAPIGASNTPILCLSPNDDAQFGQQLPGFTIPQALDAIRKQGNAVVVVINVFNATTNTATVSLEPQTITGGKLKLANAPIGTVQIFANDGTTPFAGVQDVDYTLDAFGNFVALSAVAAETTILKFTYKKLDTGTIPASQIIGSNTGGVRTGIKVLELVKNTFGFKPKILICPKFIELPAVATEFAAVAPKYRAIYLPDAPVGTTLSAAFASRGASATGNFKTTSQRAYLLFPHLLAYDGATDSNIAVPYSSYMAGVISRVDREEGFWVSPSNHEILGIVGTEIPVLSDFTDPNSEANQLNAIGITTIYNEGSIRTWGNRSAAFPTDTSPKNFLNVRRAADVIHESLELASFLYVDKPINQATIDTIREAGNSFMRTLIGRGACLTGSRVEYVPANNPPSELAAGHIQFELVYMVPTPAERITFKSTLDINLLSQLA